MQSRRRLCKSSPSDVYDNLVWVFYNVVFDDEKGMKPYQFNKALNLELTGVG